LQGRILLSNLMTIDRKPTPVGTFTLMLRYFNDEVPPCAILDVSPESDDDSLGGFALNSLSVGQSAKISDLSGARYSFGTDSENPDSEIRESVFWRPRDQTLEIESLILAFGKITNESIELDVSAKCFDHDGNTNIAVTFKGDAKIIYW
jgi:hypothetical protein